MKRTLALVATATLLVTGPAGAGVINGDFSNGLSGWIASGPVSVAGSPGSEVAFLDEAEALLDATSLRQVFAVPVGRDPSLSFTFAMFVDGDAPEVFPPDAFLVSLLDPATLDPLASSPSFSDLFAVEFDGFAADFSLEAAASLVAVAEVSNLTTSQAFGIGGEVTIDLSSLPAGTEVLVEYRLAGGCDGFHSHVLIDHAATNIAAHLDIKPESCPNPMQVSDSGLVPVAVTGSADFDVMQVDPSSIELTRADGVGTAVQPRGHAVEDVATPFAGELCDCHELGADGLTDLSLKFSAEEVVTGLELARVPVGTLVTLSVSGHLVDGTVFHASDCIRIESASQRMREREGSSRDGIQP